MVVYPSTRVFNVLDSLPSAEPEASFHVDAVPFTISAVQENVTNCPFELMLKSFPEAKLTVSPSAPNTHLLKLSPKSLIPNSSIYFNKSLTFLNDAGFLIGSFCVNLAPVGSLKLTGLLPANW